MKVPDSVFNRIKHMLWSEADELRWLTVSDSQKSILYERWINAEEVGGVLSRYIEHGSIRVYIKDTIMKPYMRELIKSFEPIRNLLRLPRELTESKCYIKPHGRLLSDGKLVCWGLSRDWKSILFAAFDRAYQNDSLSAFAAVILLPTGKCLQPEYRKMVEVAAEKLCIENLVWHDG